MLIICRLDEILELEDLTLHRDQDHEEKYVLHLPHCALVPLLTFHRLDEILSHLKALQSSLPDLPKYMLELSCNDPNGNPSRFRVPIDGTLVYEDDAIGNPKNAVASVPDGTNKPKHSKEGTEKSGGDLWPRSEWAVKKSSSVDL